MITDEKLTDIFCPILCFMFDMNRFLCHNARIISASRRQTINIFYVDSDPIIAARNMVDRHVVKMILETAQLLSTAHRFLDGTEMEVSPDMAAGIDRLENVISLILKTPKKPRKKKVWKLSDDRDSVLYSATHINHPSALWVRKSSANYDWLYSHLLALGAEYTHRYGRTHATIDKLGVILKTIPTNIKQGQMTKMPSCMDQEYAISLCPVTNYRNYYNYGKVDLLRWTNRVPPLWIEGEIIQREFCKNCGEYDCGVYKHSHKTQIYTIGR